MPILKTYQAEMTIYHDEAALQAAITELMKDRHRPIKVCDYRDGSAPERQRLPALLMLCNQEWRTEEKTVVSILGWKTLETALASSWRSLPEPNSSTPAPDPAAHSLWFGIHQGKPLPEVPAGYLEWVLTECRFKLSHGLRAAIAEQLRRAAGAKS